MEYKKYEKLLKQISRKTSMKSGISYEEIFGVALEIFSSCRENYKPSKNTKFSTYLNIRLKHLKNYSKKLNEKRQKEVTIDNCVKLESPINENSMIRAIDFKKKLNECSKDTKFVINTILNPPDNLLSITESKKINQTTIKKYMKYSKGWSYWKIRIIFSEIKKFMQTMYN